MRVMAPNGAVIDAAEESVARLLENGFSPVKEQKPAPKPAPKRRAPRKTQKASDKK